MMENKYSDYIMQCVRQNLGLDKNDTSHDHRINQMSKDQVLDRVVTWNGLIGYGNTIKEWVEDIWGIDLDYMD